MAWQSSGGSGYPGVTGDGSDGLVVTNSLTAGSAADPLNEGEMTFNGATELVESVASAANSDPVGAIVQGRDVPLNSGGGQACLVRRFGDIAAQDYTNPTVQFDDFTLSSQPVIRLSKNFVTVLEVTNKVAVTGQLSAVTDANAKAVLTSLLALLTGIKIATDSTT